MKEKSTPKTNDPADIPSLEHIPEDENSNIEKKLIFRLCGAHHTIGCSVMFLMPR